MCKRIIPFFILLVACAVFASAEDKPKEPSEATLIGGHLHYSPPADDDWQKAENVNADDEAAYARRDHQGAIAIQVLPADAEMSPQMGPAVIRSLRDAHKKADQKILFGPKIEPDKRFALKVHEKYQAGDKVADELHIYRNIGPRVVMLTVNAWLTDEAGIKQIQEAGQAMLAGAKWSAKK
jgi:hypothetical protein